MYAKNNQYMLETKSICTELPGTRFEDPYGHDPEVKEPVYLGIQ